MAGWPDDARLSARGRRGRRLPGQGRQHAADAGRPATRASRRAYNRWYERDHFYAGCMIGPFLFAGSRWVATRALKDLRWPADDETVADPPDAGSYVAIYWVEHGHHADHFDVWARHQVRELYAQGRGFAERKHTHTVLFDHLGAVVPRRRIRCRSSSRSTTATTGSSSPGSTPRRATTRAPRTPSLAHGLAARAARRFHDRDRQLVDAVGGRERSARRARWISAARPAARSGCASSSSSPATCSDALPAAPRLHRRDRSRRPRHTSSRRPVLPHRRRHRHLRRPALVS